MLVDGDEDDDVEKFDEELSLFVPPDCEVPLLLDDDWLVDVVPVAEVWLALVAARWLPTTRLKPPKLSMAPAASVRFSRSTSRSESAFERRGAGGVG